MCAGKIKKDQNRLKREKHIGGANMVEGYEDAAIGSNNEKAIPLSYANTEKRSCNNS